MSTVLDDINKAAIAYNEALVLAKRIYNRIPDSQNAYKWVEANQGFMSPSFNKALYLKASDLEYYNFKNVWILSPNDEYKMVRQFARIEDYNIDAYGTIVNASYEPWLKVAIGTTQNMTVFSEIVPALRFAQLALENISATFFKDYKTFVNSGTKLFPEFQGNMMELDIIEQLLQTANIAWADAGGLDFADTVGQLLYQMYKNDTSVFLQMEDVNLVREGAYIDAIQVIAPSSNPLTAYSTITTFSHKKDEALLSKFQDNQTKTFAISVPSSDPYYVVHPKLVGGLREIINVYAVIKQRKLNDGLNVNPCPSYKSRAVLLINRVKQNQINTKEAAYNITFEMLTIIKNLRQNCDVNYGRQYESWQTWMLNNMNELTPEIVTKLKNNEFPTGIIVLIPDGNNNLIAIENWTKDKPQSGAHHNKSWYQIWTANNYQTNGNTWKYIDINLAVNAYKHLASALEEMIQ